jgi:hypothetical protein
VNLKYTIDGFLKSYSTTERKWENAENSKDRFELSTQVMKKIFNIKHYETTVPMEGETVEAAKERSINRLIEIMSKHL